MKQKHLFFVSAMAVMFTFFTAQTGYGFNPADLAILKTTDHCPGCDLSGAILTGATWVDRSTCQAGSIGECKK